jgi:hypothetical protein
MTGLDPSIVEHHIDTWPDITPVRRKQRPLHPSKETTIKAKIDKLRASRFIYPIAYTSWVSNPILVNKKQGIIHVCMDFRDLNQACPKDNFPTPFIDQIINDCAGHKALWMVSFMDGFFGYNQIQHIILAYLDDLTARSKKCTQHLDDLQIIFQECCQYNIHLNPFKCVFYVTMGRLLEFIISQSGITVDPLKFQDITEIPPP